MSTPLVSIATRCQCCADDLESLKAFIRPDTHPALRETVKQLRRAADRLNGLPDLVPRPAALPLRDAPVSVGRGPQ